MWLNIYGHIYTYLRINSINFHIIYSQSRIHLPCSHTFFIYFIQDLQQISSNLLTLFKVGNKLIHT
ncbi:Trafficking particle complex subunit 11 [Gossypium arboreum]|uniref:Trafficking particle complex subunit 11 n=1 Tax=Gossypium arboreum TaxID=29729 RepID=A0A0B0MBA3_GOSAR|nr:Trafficking particle complex subunit 11 [Gossypium arboreum]